MEKVNSPEELMENIVNMSRDNSIYIREKLVQFSERSLFP